MQNNYDKDQLVYAGFFVRLCAYLMDSLILSVLLLAVRIPLWALGTALPDGILSANVIFTYSLTAIALYLCKVAYFSGLTYTTGQTLGKRAMNIKVVAQDKLLASDDGVEGENSAYGSEKRESGLNLWNIIYRESVGRFLSGIIIDIGYLMIGPDEEKRALHDRLCDTYVVYEKRIKVVNVVKNVIPPVPAEVETVQPLPAQTEDISMPEQQAEETEEAPAEPVAQRGSWVVSDKKGDPQ